MPAVINQIEGLSVSDKMQIMEYLMRSIRTVVEQSCTEHANGDFSCFAGRWTLEEAQAFDAATSREIDEEDWK